MRGFKKKKKKTRRKMHACMPACAHIQSGPAGMVHVKSFILCMHVTIYSELSLILHVHWIQMPTLTA